LKTLDEYLAEKSANKPTHSLPIRKPNEGHELKDVKPLQREEDEVMFGAKVLEMLSRNHRIQPSVQETAKSKKVKEVKAKQVLEIEQMFTPPSFGERGNYRGGRGGPGRGGRGGRGFGRGRGSRSSSGVSPPDVADATAFPTLA
jgi:hypothetical protein